VATHPALIADNQAAMTMSRYKKERDGLPRRCPVRSTLP
jgi:hypothetical protein